MADAEPREISVLSTIKDSRIDSNGIITVAFELTPIDAETNAVLTNDFSAIYTESLVEIGAIVYPFMGYIITVDESDIPDDVIISIVDNSDDGTVYSAYLTEEMIFDTSDAITFTEGDTPPDVDDGGGGDDVQS